MTELENVNPLIFKKSDARSTKDTDYDESVVDPFDEREIFGKQRIKKIFPDTYIDKLIPPNIDFCYCRLNQKHKRSRAPVNS